jgi:hypothetical protein
VPTDDCPQIGAIRRVLGFNHRVRLVRAGSRCY